MKKSKILVFILIIALAATVIFIKIKNNIPGKTDEAVINYGTDTVFSKQDKDEAIKLIKDKFKDFKGCNLKSINFEQGEKLTEKNRVERLDWMNEIAKNKYPNEVMVDAIWFKSDFTTGDNPSEGFNNNGNYTDWNWY